MPRAFVVPWVYMKRKKPACQHDYKNAIQVGNVDYMCPLCYKLLDPGEWFFMNYFTFVDVTPKEKQPANTRKQIESKTGREAISKYRFKKPVVKRLK